MLSILKNKQMAYLFLSSFLVLFTGLGLFPILPLFAATFQASKSLIGLYFAIVYAANGLGPVAAGWLIARFPKRSILIAGGVIGVPALALLAFAHSFTAVVLLTAVLWFAGGIVMALISILTGLNVDASSQGKAFSLLALAAPSGTLVGGVFVGWLVTWRGYPFMFTVLAVIWSIIPLIAWLRLKEGRTGLADRSAPVRGAVQPGRAATFGPNFARLLAFAFLGALAVNLSRFGSSLAMQTARFSAEAISGVAVASGLATIPFTLTVGSLSDRLGRKHFLGISLLFAMSGALILTGAATVWQYGLAAILNMIAFSVSGAMVQALTGELLPANLLSRGLARLNAWIAAAGILSFAAGGLLFDLLGLPLVFLIPALLALAVGTGVEGFIHSDRTAGHRLVKEECRNEIN